MKYAQRCCQATFTCFGRSPKRWPCVTYQIQATGSIWSGTRPRCGSRGKGMASAVRCDTAATGQYHICSFKWSRRAACQQVRRKHRINEAIETNITSEQKPKQSLPTLAQTCLHCSPNICIPAYEPQSTTLLAATRGRFMPRPSDQGQPMRTRTGASLQTR